MKQVTMDTDTWTEAKCKDLLPDIRIMLEDGKIHMGYVKGRQLPFALVIVDLASGHYARYEYAWRTIARVMQTGGYLKV